MANIEQITANLADPKGDVNRILRDAETLIARFSKRESLLEMAVGDPESVKSIHEALQKLRDITAKADGILQRVDGILQRVDAMAGKTDEELYGRDGVLPQFRNILRDLLAKLVEDRCHLRQHQQDQRRGGRFDEGSEGAPERAG